MPLFKITGFILVIFTTSAIGFLKANELNLRFRKLTDLYKAIATLKEGIRLHGGDVERLINLSFAEFPINTAHLKKEDIAIIDDFFENLGAQDTVAEYERCELYINLLKTQADQAQKQHLELNRLYKNIGVLSGILICIFFL